MAKKPSKFDFRDISVGLQKLRTILLGRDHKLHGRFLPKMAPRTLPVPDIPRGPEYKYSKQYYFERSPKSSVKPPVVAPVATGPPFPDPSGKGGQAIAPDTLCFKCAPTPGWPWWWDGHCFYDEVPSSCPPPSSKQPHPCPPPSVKPDPCCPK